ncbi:5'-nucleotidase C-terminal domain-containing protein [Pararhodobacter zhoushanensis]|uniref:5'-nucleotidase C-terminal domain-containing protein n=1 Tax=Pararhodobacter zhoushanensis TaxID=2479545 RepID=A0ABT3GZA3_9RHOB|nr:metallophosphoesterase [Pararhodobacter zhoushanensis]MCW1932815.1 5'-nucleotidase C-terminal domain-containing protein [Pararhodobacter zhoushanensis]
MDRFTLAVDRRFVLRGVAASAAVLAAPVAARAQSSADAVLFTLADLHAPYARLPAMLDQLRSLRAQANRPAALLINGDIFERGNVVCLRSNAEADWAFIEALCAEMPVVINIGNHETAIVDDIASFTARADRAGAQVISNLIDRRTERFVAPYAAHLGLGGIELSLLGLAATNPFVYREPARSALTFLDTARFVADALPGVAGGADQAMILSHAGLIADKTFLDTLPDGTLVQGAHDHLLCDYALPNVHYAHGGSWGTRIGMIELSKSGGAVSARYSAQDVAASGGDAELAAQIEALKAEHLTAEDSAVVAVLPQAYDLHASILMATEALRLATESDVAMLGHTTFGAPLAAGPLSHYDLAAYLRFGGPVAVAEISGAQLAGMLALGNQFAAQSLEQRTGDYVHVAELDIDPARTYRLAVNGWTATNQAAYLGTQDLVFETVEGLELRQLIIDDFATRF